VAAPDGANAGSAPSLRHLTVAANKFCDRTKLASVTELNR
jgi:hypothetical protein